jgi:hypothetical protein
MSAVPVPHTAPHCPQSASAKPLKTHDFFPGPARFVASNTLKNNELFLCTGSFLRKTRCADPGPMLPRARGDGCRIAALGGVRHDGKEAATGPPFHGLVSPKGESGRMPCPYLIPDPWQLIPGPMGSIRWMDRRPRFMGPFRRFSFLSLPGSTRQSSRPPPARAALDHRVTPGDDNRAKQPWSPRCMGLFRRKGIKAMNTTETQKHRGNSPARRARDKGFSVPLNWIPPLYGVAPNQNRPPQDTIPARGRRPVRNDERGKDLCGGTAPSDP